LKSQCAKRWFAEKITIDFQDKLKETLKAVGRNELVDKQEQLNEKKNEQVNHIQQQQTLQQKKDKLEKENEKDQVRPPGFHMIRLPWGEEIRDLTFPVPDSLHLPPGLTDAARNVVKAMKLDGFYPGCVENPVLQRHYAAVQALALGEDKPEDTVDALMPDPGMDAKAPVFLAWRDAVDASVPALTETLGGVKRPSPTHDGENPRSRFRRDAALETPTTLEAMRELVRSGDVDRLTVPALRDWLQLQGIASGGKKADLLDRVRACA